MSGTAVLKFHPCLIYRNLPSPAILLLPFHQSGEGLYIYIYSCVSALIPILVFGLLPFAEAPWKKKLTFPAANQRKPTTLRPTRDNETWNPFQPTEVSPASSGPRAWDELEHPNPVPTQDPFFFYSSCFFLGIAPAFRTALLCERCGSRASVFWGISKQDPDKGGLWTGCCLRRGFLPSGF